MIAENPPRAWPGWVRSPRTRTLMTLKAHTQAWEPQRPALSPDPTTSLGFSDTGRVTLLCELLIPHLEMAMLIPHGIVM